MATGIKSDRSVTKRSVFKRQQEQKRQKWCFEDRVIMLITLDLRKKGSIISVQEIPGEKLDHESLRLNMERIIIQCHKTDPTKYIYPEQLSEALGISNDAIMSELHATKKGLLKIYGYALRNKHGVGYRIADCRDLLIEVDKSIDRISGMDFNAIKRLFDSIASIKLKTNEPRFYKILRNAQENFLTDISEAVDTFKEERGALAKEYSDFQDYESEIRTDINNAGPNRRV